MNIERLKELEIKSRDIIISTRTKVENELAKIQTNFLSLSPEKKASLGIDLNNLNAKTWFPCLYKEDLSNVEEEYQTEIERFKEQVLGPRDRLFAMLESEIEREVERVEKFLQS